MTIVRSTPDTMATIRTRVRSECMDPELWPNGQTKSQNLLRFTDAAILIAMNEALRFLQMERAVSDVAPDLHSASIVYSSDPMDLPVAISGTDQIWKVELVTSTSPAGTVLVEYVSHLEIEDYATIYGAIRPFRFTLEALPLTGLPTTDYPRLRIRIRPAPVSTGTFRVWYLEAPLIVSGTTDAHDFFGKWQDLVVLLSCKNLLRRDDEFSVQQQEMLDDQKKLYEKARAVQRGSQSIRRRRRGRS